MEAEANTKFPDTKSYCIEYEKHSNQIDITIPPDVLALQPNQNGVSSGTVGPSEFLMPVRSRGSDLTFPAIIVCFCCCWCTGIPAIYYASKAQSEYGAGNFVEGEKKQKLARRWMIVSALLSAVLIVAVILAVFFLIVFPNIIYFYNDDY